MAGDLARGTAGANYELAALVGFAGKFAAVELGTGSTGTPAGRTGTPAGGGIGGNVARVGCRSRSAGVKGGDVCQPSFSRGRSALGE